MVPSSPLRTINYNNDTVNHYVDKILEYGLEIIPLHGIDSNGHCTCYRKANCGKNSGKHPLDINQDNFDPTLPYNYGIPHTQSPAIITFDFDGEAGLKTLLEWEQMGLPETWKFKTGSGGFHLIFEYPNDIPFEILNWTKKVDPGVDIKVGTGYIVGPGSLHKCGQRYEVVIGPQDGLDPAQVPSFILDKMENIALTLKLSDLDKDRLDKINPKLDIILSEKLELIVATKPSLHSILNSQKYISASERDHALAKELKKLNLSDQECVDI